MHKKIEPVEFFGKKPLLAHLAPILWVVRLNGEYEILFEAYTRTRLGAILRWNRWARKEARRRNKQCR